MLKVAVCDDVDAELRRIATLADECLYESGISADLRLFSHPDALLTAMKTESFHLYLLDIVMPMVNGLELGREIRRLDCEAQIVYATTEPQFALQAYAVCPMNYLVKPIDKQQLSATLLLAVSRAALAEDRTLAVKTADSLRIVKLPDIVCCEYRSHAVLLALTSGEEITSRTLRENFTEYAAPLLKDGHFLQCHASYIVNMRRVERFTRNHFALCGGRIVPIAAKQYPTVRDQYMDYLMSREAQP